MQFVEAANAAPSTAEIRECLVVDLQRTNLILAPNIVSLISTVVSFTGSNKFLHILDLIFMQPSYRTHMQINTAKSQ